MSYTNITIPSRSDLEQMLAHEMAQAEAKFWRAQTFEALHILDNIVTAVYEHGFVDFVSRGDDGSDLRLVMKQNADEPA